MLHASGNPFLYEHLLSRKEECRTKTKLTLLKSATISKSIIGEVDESPWEVKESPAEKLRSLQMIAI